jgi:hypothetical protein
MTAKDPYDDDLFDVIEELLALDEHLPAHETDRRSNMRNFVYGARFGSEFAPEAEARIEAHLRELYVEQRKWKFDDEGWYYDGEPRREPAIEISS